MRHYEGESLDSPERRESTEIDESGEKERDKHFESTYSLRPNEQYEANEYRYKTDRYGRIQSCEGTLRLEQGKTNPAHQTRAGGEDRLETDDGGHLIARRFGGSEKVDNIVPMDSHLNRGDYKKMENEWASEVADGNTVDVKIRCEYKGDSRRPEGFTAMYTVSDENGNVINRKVCRFRNDSGGGE